MEWEKLSLLITGGTGSFGKRFVEWALEKIHPRRLIGFSRDELKQLEMRELFSETNKKMRQIVIARKCAQSIVVSTFLKEGP